MRMHRAGCLYYSGVIAKNSGGKSLFTYETQKCNSHIATAAFQKTIFFQRNLQQSFVV